MKEFENHITPICYNSAVFMQKVSSIFILSLEFSYYNKRCMNIQFLKDRFVFQRNKKNMQPHKSYSWIAYGLQD